MIAILSKYKIWIIGAVAVALLFLAYSQFIAKKSPASDASLAQVDQTATKGQSQNAAGREFVIQLLAIQSIHFNTDLFSDPAYLYLHDFSRPLVPQPAGRPNPFAPLGDDSGTIGQIATSTGLFIPSGASTTVATSTRAATSTRSGTAR